MISNINNKRQIISKKNIGILDSNINTLRQILETQNIGKYDLLDSKEGIGYISNFYANENIKPYSLGKEGLLGFTHLSGSTHPKSIAYEINKKYNFGETITYYSSSPSSIQKNGEMVDENGGHWFYDWFDNHKNHLKFNFNVDATKNIMKNLFTYTYNEDGKIKLMGINSENFASAYSVITDFINYDNIKNIMEKTRIGTIEPTPYASLDGAVVTNIYDYSGTDTKLGLITNQVYAHMLKSSAQLNSIRNTPYITPEVYDKIGNKLSTISSLPSILRIDDKTGRLIYEIGNGYNNIIDLEKKYNNFGNFSDDNNDYIGSTNLYTNLILNSYNPFNTYKELKSSNYLIIDKTWDDVNSGDNTTITEEDINNSKLLLKTLESFKSNDEGEIKNGTLISRFHTTKGADPEHNKKTLFQTSVSKFGLSHGRNLLHLQAYYNNDEYYENNPYARTWTSIHQYKKITDTMRYYHDYATGEEIPISTYKSWLADIGNTLNNSVLHSGGIPNIVPIKDNSEENVKKITNCMFSIENLAWKGMKTSLNDYPDIYWGPNDGRIMWFPPYNLSFSENIQANWNANSFIGRGEKVWTYTDTDRSGVLSFTLLIDHPSIIDKWKETVKNKNLEPEDKEHELLSFFAGSDYLNQVKTEYIDNILEDDSNNNIQDKITLNKTKNIIYVIFKANDEVLEEEVGYNNNLEKIKEIYPDATMCWSDFLNKNNLKYDKDTGIKKIILYGYSSNVENKLFLAKKRSKYIENTLSEKKSIKKGKIKKKEYEKIKCDAIDKNNPNGRSIIKARCVKIEVITGDDYKETYDEEKNKNVTKGKQEKEITKFLPERKEYLKTNFDELDYFKQIYDNPEYSFLKQRIVDKIDYFIPAFHSITPEGFTERLSFLHQCTRQGHTISTSSQGNKNNTNTNNENNNNKKNNAVTAGNMAFGRPPICVLRIGDFYNTKIIIQSINITYDAPTIQWDMNPEGIGMQPMYANINITFNFLGGSDLSGPISRLQNAVSSNYYANESVYKSKKLKTTN